MRRARTAAATVALVAATLALPMSPASAASATLNFADGVLYSGCFDVPYSYTLDLPTGTTNWSLEVGIYRPDGSKITSDFASGTGRIGTLDSDVFLCGSDDAGEMTAKGTIEGSGRTIDDYEIDFAPTTFTMRRPYSQTAAKVKGKAKCGKNVRIAITSTDERPNGFFPVDYGYVDLQQRIKGKWKGMGGYPEMVEDGAAMIPFKWAKTKGKKGKQACKPIKIRAYTLYDSDYREASYSKPIKIKP